MRALSLSGVGFVLAATACQPTSHPDRLADTLINNVCHFTFDCCTPSERALLGGGALNKAACIEEFNDTFGGFFEVASAAVAAGTAVYAAEEAERCSIQAAIDSCDAQTVLGVGDQGLNQLFYGIDATDDACVLLASRAFTRGTVKDGGACTSSFDCAEFGSCAFEEDETRGKCVAPAKEGDDCSERSCALHLNCDGTTEKCVAEVLLDNGASCASNRDCTSGACVGEGTCSNGLGTCFAADDCNDFDFCSDEVCADSGAACTEDADCNTATCDNGPVCGEAEKITVEICDGL